MTHRVWKALALAVAGCALLAIPSVAAASPKVVILRSDVDPVAKVTQYNIAPTQLYTNGFHGFAADVDDLTAQLLANDAEVVMVSADQAHSFAPTSLDGTRFRGLRFRGVTKEAAGTTKPGNTPIEQIPQITARGLRRIGGALSRTASIDGKGKDANVDIAVIDSGVQVDQPDLNVVGGTDCTGGNNIGDVEGHGTIVAGVLGAKDNGFGVVGSAPGARIWSVRVLDENLSAEDSSVLCAIDWVSAHASTIDVANMSIAGDGSDDRHCGTTNGDAIHYAICQAVAGGVTVVAGAGNEGVKVNATIPAAYSEVISVSAMVDSDGAAGGTGGPDPCEGFADDTFAPFSNWGSRVDLAAPGVCIASTFIGSDVAVDSGTSFAAPFVSGAAALWMISGEGSRELRGVSAKRRAAKVREALLEKRERAHLAGDPDRSDEGIVNIARI